MNQAPSDAAPGSPKTAETVDGLSMAAAALALGYALQAHTFVMTRRAAIALAASLALAAQALLRPRARLSARLEDRLFLVTGVIAIVYGSATFIVSAADVDLARALMLPFSLGVCGAALVAVMALRTRPLLGGAHLVLLLVLWFAIGIWVLQSCPIPSIDVYLFHTEGLKALLSGASPYSSTIPNIYGAKAHRLYGEGLVVGGRVQVGCPYPPLSLILALPGYVAGDYRYVLPASIVVAAGLLASSQPGRRARIAAMLLLFTPRIFFIHDQGWTEPFMVLALAGVTFCAVRARRLLPVALGAFLATKQYSLLALPAVVLLFPRGTSWRQISRVVVPAVLIAAAVTVPFVVWDPGGFLKSVVLFQFEQPYRPDSLGFVPVVAKGHAAIAALAGSAPGIIAASLALALSLWRAPRSPAGFAAAVALTFFAFFAFAKQAFWNYYLFVLGAMACAVAASAPTAAIESTGAARRSPSSATR